MREIRLVAGMELRTTIKTPGIFALLFVMPLVLIAFTRSGVLRGADQAVPGMAILFAFFIVGQVGFSFFREHGWNTWERLRTLPARPVDVVVGKALPYAVLSSVQLTTLLLVGGLLLDMSVRGSAVALALTIVLLATCTVSLGVLLVSLTNSIQQLSIFANLTAVLFGGVGGAFAAVSSYPTWVQVVAHVTPQFWAMEALRAVTAGTGGVGDVAPNLLALALFAVAFVAVAVKRFDVSATKRSYGLN